MPREVELIVEGYYKWRAEELKPDIRGYPMVDDWAIKHKAKVSNVEEIDISSCIWFANGKIFAHEGIKTSVYVLVSGRHARLQRAAERHARWM